MHLVAAVLALAALVTDAPVRPTQAASEHRSMELHVGKPATISLKDVRNYSLTHPEIVHFIIGRDGKSAVLTPVRPGVATLYVVRDDGSKLTYDITSSS